MPRKKTSPTLANLKYYFDLKHYVDQNQLTTEQAETLSTRLHHEKILKLIDTGVISAETVLGLRYTQWLVLISDDSIMDRVIKRELNIAFVDYPILEYYINEKKLTPKQAKTLWTRLENENARKVIFANITSLETFTDLRSTQWDALNDDFITGRVISGELDIAFVEAPFFQDFVNNDKLTHSQAETLLKRIVDVEILKLIKTDVISVETALDLRDSQWKALRDNFIRERLIKGELDIAFVNYPFLQNHVDQEILTLEQAKRLVTEFDNQKIDAWIAENISTRLRNENAREVIFANITSLETFTDLRSSQWDALKKDSIRERVITGELNIALVDYPFLQNYVNQKILTLEQAETLSTKLYNEKSLQLIATNNISVETALGLRKDQWDALDDDSIRGRVISGELDIAFVEAPFFQDFVNNDKLTHSQAETLLKRIVDVEILKLIKTDVISVETALDLRDSQWKALRDDSIRDRFIKGELNIAFVDCDFLQDYVNQIKISLGDAVSFTKSSKYKDLCRLCSRKSHLKWIINNVCMKNGRITFRPLDRLNKNETAMKMLCDYRFQDLVDNNEAYLGEAFSSRESDYDYLVSDKYKNAHLDKPKKQRLGKMVAEISKEIKRLTSEIFSLPLFLSKNAKIDALNILKTKIEKSHGEGETVSDVIRHWKKSKTTLFRHTDSSKEATMMDVIKEQRRPNKSEKTRTEIFVDRFDKVFGDFKL